MAKGITQAQVDTAADALLQAGERPTVDRIRAFLGTGSPNTVTRMLETWWQGLGARLTAQQVRVALPEAPAAVAVLAGQLWEQALIAAEALAQTELAEARAALDAERVDLEKAHQTARDAEAAATTAIEAARQAQALAEARLAESQRLIEQQATQLADLGRQRDALAEQVAAAEQAMQVLRDRLQAQETAATAERDAQAQHLRATEDRAHAEIDRARQEAKEVRAQLAMAKRENMAQEQAWRQQREALHRDLTTAQRDAAAQQARADALAQQLAQLPETLRVTLAQANETTAARSRRGQVAPRKTAPKAPARKHKGAK